MSANVFNPSEFKKQNRLRGLVHTIKVDLRWLTLMVDCVNVAQV